MSLHRIGARLGVVTAHAMAVVNGATSLCIEIELQSIVDQFVHSLRCCVHRGCSGKDHADCCCSESPCVAQLAHELPFEEMARPDNVRRATDRSRATRDQDITPALQYRAPYLELNRGGAAGMHPEGSSGESLPSASSKSLHESTSEAQDISFSI